MKASVYYRGKEGYNCSQAVLKAFQQEYSLSEETIVLYSQYGGGKADKGICGALFATYLLIKDLEQIRRIEAYFEEKAGSKRCKEIRKLNRLSCSDCVDLGFEAVRRTAAKR